MEQSYFKEYYQLERENWWFTVRRMILGDRINHLLNKPTGISSLNIGAATGTTSDMLTSFGEVMSVEFDENCYQFTKKFLSTPIIQGSITDLPFKDNQYDLVCAFDVIEHVENDVKAIDEMIRVCKPGGHIAITVPAYMFLWGPHDLVNHHFRRYTLNQLTTLIQQHQGTIIYKTYFNSMLFIPIAAFRIIVHWIEKIKSKTASTGQSDHAILGTKGILNGLLAGIFKIDYYLLKWGVRFPSGVSIMVFFQKKT